MDVSVVITSYNTREHLERCLRSVFGSDGGVRYEVFVVDNNSTDGSCEMVASTFPDARLIRNAANVGFAKANNAAIDRAAGRFILVLNPDTEITPTTLTELCRRLDERSDIGAAGVKLVRDDGSMDDACRRGFPTPLNALAKFLRLDRLFPRATWLSGYNLRSRDPDGEYEVDAIVGAFMFLRREAVVDVGPLDESYFMYGEDLDWCWRLKRRGWKIHYFGNMSVRHTKGASTRQVPVAMNWYFHRAMLIFHKKHLDRHYPFFVNWLVSLGIAVRFLFRSLWLVLRRRGRAPIVPRQVTK